jgi:hypothetical protein
VVFICLTTLPEAINVLLWSVLIQKRTLYVPCLVVLTRSGSKFPMSQVNVGPFLKGLCE